MNLALRSVEELLNANEGLPRVVRREPTVNALVDLQIEIQDRIREYHVTTERLPDGERRFLTAGTRCSWPSYPRDWFAYNAEDARMPRILPSNPEIDRAKEVRAWIAWLAARDPIASKVVLMSFGRKTQTAKIARAMRCNRETVRRIKRDAIQKIMAQFFLTPAGQN